MGSYSLIFLRGPKPLNPLIFPPMMAEPWETQTIKGPGEDSREGGRRQFGSLIWFAWAPFKCVCLCVEQMLTAHHNPFIPIPHHAWLHQPPNNPWEPRQNLHPIWDINELLERLPAPGAWSLCKWLVLIVFAEVDCTRQKRAARSIYSK